jgi:hypothetical protein
MNRATESALIQFCCEQQADFREECWLRYPHPDRQEFVAAALFLAGMGWYGHVESLGRVAERLQPGCVGNFAQLAARVNFDCSRFSNNLRRALNLTKTNASHAQPSP